MADLKTYAIDGITIEVDVKKLRKWNMAKLLAQISGGNTLLVPDLIEMVLADKTETLLYALDPDGNPDVEDVMNWFTHLLEAMSLDDETKN